MSADALSFALALVLACALPGSVWAGGGQGDVPPGSAPPGAEAAPPGPDGACAGEIAARLQTRFGEASQLSARFEQRSESTAYPEPQRSSGAVEFAKPGKMRWEYEKPQASLVVSDGETMWIVDPEAKEVQRLPVDQGFLSGTPLHVLLNGGVLEDAFELSAEGCSTGPVTLRLVPREAATYESLELLVDAASGDVRQTRLADLLGTVTTVDLSELQVDPGLGPERFVYVPSPDERVLELAN